MTHGPTPFPFAYNHIPYTILDRKGTPFCIPLIDKCYPLFILYIYFATQNVHREKKNTLQNESGEESLNRNHRAYNLRLPQLQLIMATHAQLQLVYNNY